MASRTYRSSAHDSSAGSGVYSSRPHDLLPDRGGRRNGATKTAKRRKDPLWAKLFVTFGALLMMASGGVIVGGRVLISQATDSVNRQNLLGDAGVSQGQAADIDGPINLLLIGLDFRESGPEDLVRSDTIVILHVPASHDQAYLISIPRDTRVKIPDYPKTKFKGYSTKINAAFAFGHQGGGTENEKRARGVELLAMTLKDLTGIQFNGAAIIDFVGFEKILKQLNGVTICVDHEAESIHLAENKDGKLQRVWYDDAAGRVRDVLPGYHPVKYKPGCQRLSPEKALDFSRIRKGLPNGDYDRQKNQQKLLKAIAKEATSAGIIANPAKLMGVAEAAGQAFTLDTQGVPIEDFVFTLKGVAANDLTMVKTNGGQVNSIAGSSDEQLTGESMAMLAAVRQGKLLEFLSNHPHFVAQG